MGEGRTETAMACCQAGLLVAVDGPGSGCAGLEKWPPPGLI